MKIDKNKVINISLMIFFLSILSTLILTNPTFKNREEVKYRIVTVADTIKHNFPQSFYRDLEKMVNNADRGFSDIRELKSDMKRLSGVTVQIYARAKELRQQNDSLKESQRELVRYAKIAEERAEKGVKAEREMNQVNIIFEIFSFWFPAAAILILLLSQAYIVSILKKSSKPSLQ